MTRKMDKKVQGKNIFESGFDSFELDDGFLLKMDADSKKHSLTNKEPGEKKGSSKILEKLNNKGMENNTFDRNAKYYDLSLCDEDLNESDFFDFRKTKKHSSEKKVDCNQVDDKQKNSTSSNTLSSCFSPIMGSKSVIKTSISSSTPLKSSDNSSEEKPKTCQEEVNSTPKAFEFDYVEADLFEDWNLDEINKCETERDTVTLSQALQLLEEAKESVQKKALNKSFDLLTGEVVGAEMESLFAQSFDKLKSVEKAQVNEKKVSSDDSVILIDDSDATHIPAAAQKLNFDYKNLDEVKEKEKDLDNICFSSDDDFDFFTQDLLGKVKRNSTKPDHSKVYSVNNSNESVTLPKCDLNDSTEDVINLKRRKSFNVIESDTTEDSPSPKFQRQKKTKSLKQRNFKDDSAREFVDFEAEVSEGIVISSDEADEEGEYDQSFLDEESYFTQNCSADMTAKYLQSVKGFSRPGTFKIPAMKPYDPERIFSQVPEENSTDYQLDSFCVNDVEEDEVKTDLSDLEIAEKILEMDKKEKRKKRFYKSKKVR